MAGDVDTQFGQYQDGQRVDPGSFSACGKSLKTVAEVVIDQTFGHLGTAGVMGTEEKDTFFHGIDYIRFNGCSNKKAGATHASPEWAGHALTNSCLPSQLSA